MRKSQHSALHRVSAPKTQRQYSAVKNAALALEQTSTDSACISGTDFGGSHLSYPGFDSPSLSDGNNNDPALPRLVLRPTWEQEWGALRVMPDMREALVSVSDGHYLSSSPGCHTGYVTNAMLV